MQKQVRKKKSNQEKLQEAVFIKNKYLEVKKPLVEKMFLWLFLWFGFWGGYYLLNFFGFSYTKGFIITSAYYLLVSIIVILVFRKHFYIVFKEFSAIPFVFLGGIILASFATYWFANLYLGSIINSIAGISIGELESISYSYLITKIFEILVQQTFIVLLISFYIEAKMSLKKLVLTFILFFGGIHLVVFYTEGILIGGYYFFSSLIAGILFPIIIKKYNCGFIYTFSIHYGFYVLSGLIILIPYIFRKL